MGCCKSQKNAKWNSVSCSHYSQHQQNTVDKVMCLLGWMDRDFIISPLTMPSTFDDTQIGQLMFEPGAVFGCNETNIQLAQHNKIRWYFAPTNWLIPTISYRTMLMMIIMMWAIPRICKEQRYANDKQSLRFEFSLDFFQTCFSLHLFILFLRFRNFNLCTLCCLLGDAFQQ